MRSRTALLMALGLAGIIAVTPSLFPRANAGDPPVTTPNAARNEIDPSTMTDADWKALLSDMEYRVLREKGTERAFSGEFWNNHEHGIYVCGGCGEPLFSADHKFESGTGWPSFYQPVAEGKVATIVDRSFGMKRVEIVCAKCGGHLGHIFPDGPEPTGERYCVNSVSLDFEASTAADPVLPTVED